MPCGAVGDAAQPGDVVGAGTETPSADVEDAENAQFASSLALAAEETSKHLELATTAVNAQGTSWEEGAFVSPELLTCTCAAITQCLDQVNQIIFVHEEAQAEYEEMLKDPEKYAQDLALMKQEINQDNITEMNAAILRLESRYRMQREGKLEEPASVRVEDAAVARSSSAAVSSGVAQSSSPAAPSSASVQGKVRKAKKDQETKSSSSIRKTLKRKATKKSPKAKAAPKKSPKAKAAPKKSPKAKAKAKAAGQKKARIVEPEEMDKDALQRKLRSVSWLLPSLRVEQITCQRKLLMYLAFG